MAERGWLGYGRRWWGGGQIVPQPVEVLDVGSDESDGASLSAVSASVAPPGGQFATMQITAVDRDFFVEQLVMNGTQGLALLVDDQGAGGAGGSFLRSPQVAHPGVFSSAFVVPIGGVVEPRTVLAFLRPGLLVAKGSRLVLQNPNAGQATDFCVWWREAA